MMKTVLTLFILCIFSISAEAQMGMMGGQMEQGKSMGQEQQMPAMQCPKMQKMQGQGMMQGGGPMMGQGMMMQEMMQTMMDIMNMQEQIINGVKASDKKMMLEKIKDMKAKMQNKMTMCSCMMGSMMGGSMCPMMGGGMPAHDMTSPHPESGSKETEKEAPPKTEQHKH
jgi:hypothetical protein